MKKNLLKLLACLVVSLSMTLYAHGQAQNSTMGQPNNTNGTKTNTPTQKYSVNRADKSTKTMKNSKMAKAGNSTDVSNGGTRKTSSNNTNSGTNSYSGNNDNADRKTK